jgi:hypothetical protein
MSIQPYPVIGIQQMKDILLRCYLNHRQTNHRFVPNFLGPAGQGKTQGVFQFVDELNALYNLDCIGLTLRLNQSDPTDLKGIPLYDRTGKRQYCTFATPRMLPIVGDPESGVAPFQVLFIDEFNQAPPTLQNLAANLMDGTIGDARLDLDRLLIVLAGNRSSDGAAVYEMPTNVRTRVLTFLVENSFPEWKAYALQKKANPAVIGYLEVFTNVFNDAGKATEESSYPNPRTWTTVSEDMNIWGEKWLEMPLSRSFVQAALGVNIGNTFFNFAEKLYAGINVEEIFQKGECLGLQDDMPMEFFYAILIELAYRVEQLLRQTKEAMEANGYAYSTQHFMQFVPEDFVFFINNVYTFLDKRIKRPFRIIFSKSIDPKLYSIFSAVLYTSKQFPVAQAVHKDLVQSVG